MESMSLLYALLETEPQDLPKEATARTTAYPDKVAAFKAMRPDQRQPVVDGLYQILYFITEHHDLPHNRVLNRAIGKVLAKAIRGEIPILVGDEDVEKLYKMLKPVVEEAVAEVKSAGP
jgi:hypothetical protein